MKYSFLFTIGPVQSFIAQARKTQDFYSGSKLLSDLIEKAIVFSKENYKCDVIFPSQGVVSKPNRYLSEFIAENDEEMKHIGNQIEEFIREEFRSISNNVLKENYKPSNFDEQIEQFLEIFWVAKPIDDKGYKTDYDSIERLLGSVKNIRKFKQLCEQGRKCSLCGERNVLFYKGNKPAYVQNDAIEISNEYRLNKGEGLCAVCFAKRFYNDKENFPSTSEIALQYTMNELSKLEIQDLPMIEKMLNKNFQLAYEDNINDVFFKKNEIDFDIKEAKRLQTRLQKESRSHNLKLSKYYAMIMFDGDNMGKWLSGSYLKPDVDLKGFHTEFSKLLGGYANWSKEYIDGKEDGIKKGKSIYAGGDDFLGFINLHFLFDVLAELRSNFKVRVDDKLEKYKNQQGELTFSAGIVIAHYKTPLGEVLNWVRIMEKEAKSIDIKKDSFSIAVLKHSGEINKTSYKWYDGDSFIPNYMKIIVSGLINEVYSNNYIKTINQEFKKLIDSEGKLDLEDKIIETEVKRLVKKSWMGNKTEKDNKINELIKILNSLNIDKKTFNNFMYFLNIADFLAREMPAKLEENKS